MSPVPARSQITARGKFVRPTTKKAGMDVAQQTTTASGTSAAFPMEDSIQIDAQLVVTAVAGAGTLSLKLQGSQDGTTWYDCAPGAAPTQSAAGTTNFCWSALGNYGRWSWTITGTSVSWSLDTQAREAM
jgi:hypothetical protein